MTRLPHWLSKIVLESLLIVISILLALAVNDWQAERDHHELAQQALVAFQHELRQNEARIEDLTPYRLGIRHVLAQPTAAHIRTPTEFQANVGADGFRAAFLTETAWETALATGALTHIDFQTVSALSLTYAMQKRVQDFSHQNIPPLVRGEPIPATEMPMALRAAATYLDELAREEAELKAAYDQALAVIARDPQGPRPTN